MTQSNDEQIFIGINNERIELTGADKEAFIAQRDAENQAKETAETARQTKLDSAITKLKALGLTESEAKIIIGLE
jgi:DNA-binding transcriptional regulator YhcF (GntR family)